MIKNFVDRFFDDYDLIGFKFIASMILLIIGLILCK